jgi:hypothetical protein
VEASFLAGNLPERQRRYASENTLAAAQTRLADVEARHRLSCLLGALLRLQEAVSAQNFGEAAGMSSRFFDDVRAEANRPATGTPAALESVLKRRDEVGSALVRSDAAVSAVFHQIDPAHTGIRRAIGTDAAMKWLASLALLMRCHDARTPA